jgi:hypothetical protein
LNAERIVDPANVPELSSQSKTARENKLICPLCGAVAVQEKCKVICHSEICRGRVVMNCSEF